MRERWPAVRVSGCLGLLAAVMMLGANESWSAPQAVRIGPRAVFSPKRDLETKVIEEMQSCPVAVNAGAPKIECVTSILRQAGATPEALAFTAMLGGEARARLGRSLPRNWSRDTAVLASRLSMRSTSSRTE